MSSLLPRISRTTTTTSRVQLITSHLQINNLSAMSSSQPNITLYSVNTPNGVKVSIALEELGIPYKLHAIDFPKMEQKEPWFLKINPNGRIPAIVDHSRGDFRVFESGAILLYLVEHYDPQGKLWPKSSDQRSEVIQWIMFQMGGLGPMQGQANHFFRYAPEKIPYGIKRYQDETRRLYKVLDTHLGEGREYLAAGQFTIADIANVGWVRSHNWAGVSLDDLPNLQAWLDRITAREAVIKGLDVPHREPISKEDEEKKAKEVQAWILKGNEQK